VANGLFIHRPALVRGLHEAGEPRAIDLDGSVVDALVFASDGGGTTCAVPAPRGKPVYRPSNGAIVDGVYTGDVVDGRGSYGVAAADLTGFLVGLRDAVVAFTDTGEVRDL
jgi:hypothetical protein